MTHESMVTIRFGLLFAVRTAEGEVPRRIDVVTDVGNDSNFLTATLDRREWIPTIPILSGSTAGTEHISRVVGRLPLPLVIYAYRRGYRARGRELPRELIENLTLAAQAKARTLPWISGSGNGTRALWR